MFYLLLNMIVSAVVAGAVLFIYDKFGRPDCAGGIGSDSGVTITGVSGVGAVKNEQVVLRNTGNLNVLLTGWTLRDSSGVTFELPQLTLYPEGTVIIHSGDGEDSITDLYWRLTESLWEPGELVVLYDTQGLARAFYRIP